MKYYIQRHASGYVGNCFLWWSKDGNGDTCNLDNAKVFDGEDARFQSIAKDGSKYTAWEKDYIDACAHRHIDHQYVSEDAKGIRTANAPANAPVDCSTSDLRKRIADLEDGLRQIAVWNQQDQDEPATCAMQWRGCVAIARELLKPSEAAFEAERLVDGRIRRWTMTKMTKGQWEFMRGVVADKALAVIEKYRGGQYHGREVACILGELFETANDVVDRMMLLHGEKPDTANTAGQTPAADGGKQ